MDSISGIVIATQMFISNYNLGGIDFKVVKYSLGFNMARWQYNVLRNVPCVLIEAMH